MSRQAKSSSYVLAYSDFETVLESAGRHYSVDEQECMWDDFISPKQDYVEACANEHDNYPEQLQAAHDAMFRILKDNNLLI